MGKRIWTPDMGVTFLHAGRPSAAGGDWWDPDGEGLCVWAAYQPRGAASLVASYTDLSGNGNDAGVGVAPTWNAVDGWQFNGVDQYLTTSFVPQDDQSQSMIVQFTNVTNNGRTGAYQAADRRFLLSPDVGGANVGYYNGNVVFAAPRLLAGNLCVAGSDGYRNGASEGLAIGAWGGIILQAVAIGAEQRGAGPVAFLAFYVQAFALYDCTLTGAQVAKVQTAMAAL